MRKLARYISDKKFEELRENGEAEPELLYIVRRKKAPSVFAWSVDGEGFYFYASKKEYENEHGKEVA